MINSAVPSAGAIDSRTGAREAGNTPMSQASERPATGLILELPLPPSVNRLTARLGNKSIQVQRWQRMADGYLYANPGPRWLRMRAVKGPFAADVWWTKAERGRSDIDNRIKPLLDYLQRIEVIENDMDCELLTVRWGDAPLGCRVRVLPWVQP